MKRIICLIAAVLSAVCLLCACGWDAENANGGSGGPAETEASVCETEGHKGLLGERCKVCGEIISVTINVPEGYADVLYKDHNLNRVTVDGYEFDGNEIVFSVTVTKLEDKEPDAYCGFLYRVLGKDGKPLRTGPITLSGMAEGEQRQTSFRFHIDDLKLPAGEREFTIEIKDYDGF